ncbi:MAG: RluA family pseudouridine synthase [Holosporales bacterium]|jgi:23S rRNA pseudouridine955/2504/2580 synthase|nr:RluA family pseudouridine synthase [Holosporales bacterium]
MKWNEAVIQDKDADVRLDKYLKEHFNLPFSAIQKLIRKGVVKLDNRKAHASDRLIAGQLVCLPASLAESASTECKQIDPNLAQKLDPLIILQNTDLIVINKPSGLPVQAGSKVSLSLDDMLISYNHVHGTSLKLVHRLDKSTSGALIIATSRESARVLTNLFKEKDVNKLYWAIVEGAPKESQGIVDIPLAKRLIGGEELMVPDQSPNGLKALTKFKIIRHINDDKTWLALEPITGRTHQLRAHCKAMNWPIVGDIKYGAKTKGPMCLHARRIQIANRLDVLAEPPSHFNISPTQEADDFIKSL